MGYLFFESLLSFFVLLMVVIGLIISFVSIGKKKKHLLRDKEWYLDIALSREDAVSQLFLLLSFFFFGVTLLALNTYLNDLFSWRAVLFITSAVGLISAYLFKTVYTLIFSLVGITSWWVAQAAEWLQNKDIKTSAIFTGLAFIALLFYIFGHLHEKEIKFKRFALVFLVLGITIATSALFFFSTKSGLGVLGYMTRGKPFFGSWQITLSLFIFIASIIGATIYSAGKKLISPFELIAVFVFTALFGLVSLLPEQNMFVQASGSYNIYDGGQLSGSGVLWALIFNLAVFLELLGLIFSGYFRKEGWLINIGSFFLFLLIIVKYFDWFFTFLDKGIFFISAGVIFFVIGWFMEKGRRYMLTEIKFES